MRFTLKNNLLIPEQAHSKIFCHENSTTFHSITNFKSLPTQTLNHNFTFNKNIQLFLSGRKLLIDETPFTIDEIQAHYENGYISYNHGITILKNKPLCHRCGNTSLAKFAAFNCARCGENCTYCRNCIMMGRISTCTPLITWTGPQISSVPAENPLAWTGTLSVGQAAAAAKIVKLITGEDKGRDLLVWAVCGSGKTELLFPGIETALQENKRICIATPRTDVVIELSPRLQAAFPNTKIASLYGGSDDRHEYAQLTIATTHQLVRFHQAFDIIIIDEVDAFPYSIDKSLQFAVGKAQKPDTKIIYLTATPSTEWQRDCKLGRRNHITIPARYHRHPLPVPTLRWCGDWTKKLNKNRLPKTVTQWLRQRLKLNKQTMLFFPNIKLMEAALPIVANLTEHTASVHAEDPNRHEKVQQMRKGQIRILLTTTILERGVTFPNIDVAVIGAEERVFTESALVQIAGRVGRNAAHPSGEIIFFHHGKTTAMIKAKRHIEMMNKFGRKMGLLD